MTDEFDRFLAAALHVPEREPDRLFVRSVQARIALDERLSGQRAVELRRLAIQVVAVAAVAAGVLWLVRSPTIAQFGADSPAVVLAALLAGFSFLVALLASVAPPAATTRARI